MRESRLALGTVQFGRAYGVANRTGRVPLAGIKPILARAWEAGLRVLDTAATYGESETRLGEAGVAGWRIVSKLSPGLLPAAEAVEAWALASLRTSLERLRVQRLYGWLVHRAAQLLEPQGTMLYKAMQEARARGWVEKIGVSVYTPSDLEALCPHFHFDLVQAPLNILDRQLVETGWLAALRASGTEVHVRSVFLQGLLLMSPDDRPPAFRRWQPLWDRWHRWLQESGQSAVGACLGYVLSQTSVDRVVVGVDCLAQLDEILAAARLRPVAPPTELRCNDPNLIDPSRWEHP